MPEFDEFSSKMAASGHRPFKASKTAIVLVDLVNDYVEPDGAMPIAEAGPVLSRARELVELGRQSGVLIIWVRPGHVEDRDGLFRKRIPHAYIDSWGAQIHDSLGRLESERVVTKRRYSAFFQTDLDLILREHRVKRVIVCGVALNICVRSTIHDAFFNGYDVWLARDASKATGSREEESTVYDIETHFGEVLTVDEIRAEVDQTRAQAGERR